MAAARSHPALVTRNAVDLVLLRDEGLGADGLSTAVTGEAALVPGGAVVLQHAGAWKREESC